MGKYWTSETEALFEGFDRLENDERKREYYERHLHSSIQQIAVGLVRRYNRQLELHKIDHCEQALIVHFYELLMNDKLDLDKGRAYSYFTKVGYHKLLGMKIKHDNDLRRNPTISIFVDENVNTNDIYRFEAETSPYLEHDYELHIISENIDEFIDFCDEHPLEIIQLGSSQMNSDTVFAQLKALRCACKLIKNNINQLEDVRFLGEFYDKISDETGLQNTHQIRTVIMKMREYYNNNFEKIEDYENV